MREKALMVAAIAIFWAGMTAVLIGGDCARRRALTTSRETPVAVVPTGHHDLPVEVVAHFADGSSAAYTVTRWTPPVERDTSRFVSTAQMAEALVAAGWPYEEAGALAVAATWCEAPFYELTSTPDGWGIVGNAPSIGINMRARGDHGLAVGPLAIRSDVHGEKMRRHDVETLDGAVAAATEIRAEAIRIGWHPLRPWSCAR